MRRHVAAFKSSPWRVRPVADATRPRTPKTLFAAAHCQLSRMNWPGGCESAGIEMECELDLFTVIQNQSVTSICCRVR